MAYSRNLSSQFWRPPTRHLGLSRVTLLPVILGGESVPDLLQLLVADCVPRLMGWITSISASIVLVPAGLCLSEDDTCHWIQDPPHHLGLSSYLKTLNLVISAKAPPPPRPIHSHSQFLGMRTWAYIWGDHHSAHYSIIIKITQPVGPRKESWGRPGSHFENRDLVPWLPHMHK